MNADNLKKMYGSTPESFRQCVEQTLAQSPDHAPHRAPVRRALRLALVCALLLALLTAAAYAVFSPRVAEVFGAAYGPAAQEKLQAGKSAQPESSIDLDGVRYTLHEVTYIDSGLYAVATIRPVDGAKIVLLPQEEDDPDTPVGTDRYNAIHPGSDAPTYGEKAAETGAQEDAQAYNDLANMCSRFEKKIHDLELTRMISIQMGPQTRLIQNNDSLMLEKIQSSLVNTIPLWKSQMVLSLGLEHSRQATAAQSAVTNMTNELLQKNADMLKMGTIETAKEAERSVVDIQTLQHTNQQLISTLDEVMKIQQDGAQKRREAEVELGRIEGELKQKLLELRG